MIYDQNGDVAFIEIKNRDYKKIRCSLIDTPREPNDLSILVNF